MLHVSRLDESAGGVRRGADPAHEGAPNRKRFGGAAGAILDSSCAGVHTRDGGPGGGASVGGISGRSAELGVWSPDRALLF